MTVSKVYKYYRESEHRKLGVFMQKPKLRRTLVATGSYEGRDGLIRSDNRSRRQDLSRSDYDGRLCRDSPANAAYRAVVFTWSAPESDMERTVHWIADLTYPIWT
ncbi:hypothetical protein Taro_022893 [Colocasia esculenta]|uniref:Uncharacterized protein n=1 Tax=Colocasia esculenta TaxID=4460 RepID=A0A843V9Q6_COLES|nr:hypothetical protein [Colocasia esculenta]